MSVFLLVLLGRILYLFETPTQLCGLGNVTAASINIGVRSKCVKLQFGVSLQVLQKSIKSASLNIALVLEFSVCHSKVFMGVCVLYVFLCSGMGSCCPHFRPSSFLLPQGWAASSLFSGWLSRLLKAKMSQRRSSSARWVKFTHPTYTHEDISILCHRLKNKRLYCGTRNVKCRPETILCSFREMNLKYTKMLLYHIELSA